MLPHYTSEQVAFLDTRKEHIRYHQGEGPLPSAVVLINKGEGSLNGCIGSLISLHTEIANQTWFAEQNLTTFKLHSYVVAKLMYIRAKTTGEEGFLHEATWFYPLLSDHEPLIRYWLSFQPESDFFKRRIANPNQNEYRFYQLTLALNGQWEELGRRAEVFLHEPPAKMKKYAPDMRFYLALAQQDKAGMEAALTELTTPKVFKSRQEPCGPYVASQFVVTFACLYAKTARRHGFELDIDTVLIPKEWLPVAPLPDYPDPYDFMHKWPLV